MKCKMDYACNNNHKIEKRIMEKNQQDYEFPGSCAEIISIVRNFS